METKEVLIPIKRLYQFSTARCTPCNMFKNYIETAFKDNLIKYHYINLEGDKVTKEEVKLAKELKISSVPRFVVIEEGKIVEDLQGLSSNQLRASIKSFFDEV
jgi:thioredoxin-like negative regulator of GroEL